MSHMAGKTFPVGGDHLMGYSDRHVFVGMTGKAELSALLCQQSQVLRGMGIMTGATLSLLKGHVLDIATSLKV